METQHAKPIILIVDDRPANINVLNEILRTDYKIFFTTKSTAVLDMAKKKQPDLILLDIIMPEMDGYSVCNQLKHDPETQHIPIIFITSKNEPEEEIKGFELGAVDYITKPFNNTIVLVRVKTHLAIQLAHHHLELAHQKLALQNDDLRKADELRKDVEQIYRHDLKSPLSGIIGYSEMAIKRKDLADDIKEDFQIIRDSANKAFQMINLSLVIFKIEQGTYQYKKENIEVLSLLHTICADLKATKKNTIHLLLNDKPITNNDKIYIEGEYLLNYSLFSNLIKNALEASPDINDINININSIDSDKLSISIHNYGAVPVEIRERFFDKYITAGKRSGTGLGTYSSKLLAEAQEGTISLESSNDNGTTITVILNSA